jgi:hypothetical protein
VAKAKVQQKGEAQVRFEFGHDTELTFGVKYTGILMPHEQDSNEQKQTQRPVHKKKAKRKKKV